VGTEQAIGTGMASRAHGYNISTAVFPASPQTAHGWEEGGGAEGKAPSCHTAGTGGLFLPWRQALGEPELRRKVRADIGSAMAVGGGLMSRRPYSERSQTRSA
jgi:hypothetical protein